MANMQKKVIIFRKNLWCPWAFSFLMTGKNGFQIWNQHEKIHKIGLLQGVFAKKHTISSPPTHNMKNITLFSHNMKNITLFSHNMKNITLFTRGGTYFTLYSVTGHLYVFFHAEQESEIRFVLSSIIKLLTAVLCFGCVRVNI